ncbi:hypothetical protein K438DRAFT_586690 [Mycena galopus ATCC 62051]|nr:hypothetical protein K438DRAFT_586690 [Mycena galopus ATCC 62051]
MFTLPAAVTAALPLAAPPSPLAARPPATYCAPSRFEPCAFHSPNRFPCTFPSCRACARRPPPLCQRSALYPAACLPGAPAPGALPAHSPDWVSCTPRLCGAVSRCPPSLCTCAHSAPPSYSLLLCCATPAACICCFIPPLCALSPTSPFGRSPLMLSCDMYSPSAHAPLHFRACPTSLAHAHLQPTLAARSWQLACIIYLQITPLAGIPYMLFPVPFSLCAACTPLIIVSYNM